MLIQQNDYKKLDGAMFVRAVRGSAAGCAAGGEPRGSAPQTRPVSRVRQPAALYV